MAEKCPFGGYEEERFEKEVDGTLLCPICNNVLKDPVQCRNEHYFCRSCIKKHISDNSETCPICQDDLTEEMLSKPPRLLTNMLMRLKIKCDHATRGCREWTDLEFLERHVENCGYSPTSCINPGCFEVINRVDKDKHEDELCRFRTIVCEDCKQEVLRKSSRVHPCFMRRELDGVLKDVKEIKDNVSQMKQSQVDFMQNLMLQVARQTDVVDDLRRKMNDMEVEMDWNAKEATERSDWFNGRSKIFVCGGRNEKSFLTSTESYIWPANTWTKEPSMKKARAGVSAFVQERQIYVCGGLMGEPVKDNETTDYIESLSVDEEQKQWIEYSIKMPVKCSLHKVVAHENSSILAGGLFDEEHISNEIYEINPPKVLAQLPEPRCAHGCDIVDNQVVITGGRTSPYLLHAKNTVYAYDINSNECKTLPSLPFSISSMATVTYKGNVILIGGNNDKGQSLDSVLMYNVKTGQVKMLPYLNHKRCGGAAVIAGNVIIVAGGYDYDTDTFLDSVECLELNSNINAWRELPPLRHKRRHACAVLVKV